MLDEELENKSSDIDDILEGIPQEERKVAKRFLSMSMKMAHVTTPQTELMKRITAENISEITRLQSKELDLMYRESRDSKWFYVAVLVGIIIIIFGIIFMLKDNPELLKDVLIPIVTLIIGSIGGYGFGKSKRED